MIAQIDSQVGIVHIISSDPALPFNAAVYNLIPPPQDAGSSGSRSSSTTRRCSRCSAREPAAITGSTPR